MSDLPNTTSLSYTLGANGLPAQTIYNAGVPYRPRIHDLVLDKNSTIPLYLQLKQYIVHIISSGGWQPGMPLPSVRQLAKELGTARATVQHTYRDLQEQGLVVGQTGRGVYVAELAAGLPDQLAERSELLRGLFARTVSHARSLGFDEDEMVEVVREQAARSKAVTSVAPRVVFVSPLAEILERYRSLLTEALSGLDVQIECVLVSDLEHDSDARLDRLEPIRCLVSLVSGFPDLRRLASHRGTPLLAMVIDLTEETQQSLVHLPDDVPIGLVTEQHFLSTTRAMLRQYLTAEERVRWAFSNDSEGVKRVMRECRNVVHTFGAQAAVEAHRRPDTALIHLRYRPNPASVEKMRALLTTDQARQQPGA